jgi:hypothetical protein
MLARLLARSRLWRSQLQMRHELYLPTLLFLLEALTFRAKFAVEPVAATSVARAARAASSKQQKQKPERDEEQAQQEVETPSKSRELRQASATRPQQSDYSDEDDQDDGDDDNEDENNNDNDTPSSSADLLSRARHIVGSYIDNAAAGILLSDSTRAGLQLLSTRSSYVSCRAVALRGVARCGMVLRGAACIGVVRRGVAWFGCAWRGLVAPAQFDCRRSFRLAPN